METDEDLIANGVCIDIESGKIDWPMGKQMEPPVNEGNNKKGGKCSTTKLVVKQSLVMFLASWLMMCNLFE